MKLKLLLVVLLFIYSLLVHSATQVINLDAPELELIIDHHFVEPLNFSQLPTEKIVHLTYWGGSPVAVIRDGARDYTVFYNGSVTEQLRLRHKNEEKLLTFFIQGEPVAYDEKYISATRGGVVIETPEVYELTNVVLALNDHYHQGTAGMYAAGSYHQSMIKWFEPFVDHPVFKSLAEVSYYPLVENGPAYQFSGDVISPSPIYRGFRANDDVLKLSLLLNDFAKKSGFRTFYRNHKPYYKRLEKQFKDTVRPHNIWQWLERQFPARYDSYKIFFSPLGPGNHSARMYNSNGFAEAIMFISGPNRYEIQGVFGNSDALKLVRTFFTEVDHAYVNQISDMYITQINRVFKDMTPWYRGGGYGSPYLIFNEYMTWAVFSLYVKENYSPAEYQATKDYVEEFMVKKRGFYQFEAFNDALIMLYQSKPEGQTVLDLYPKILQWAEEGVRESIP